MNEKTPHIFGYATQIVSSHRRFSEEFKRDAVRLIVDEQYTFKAAARAIWDNSCQNGRFGRGTGRVAVSRPKVLL